MNVVEEPVSARINKLFLPHLLWSVCPLRSFFIMNEIALINLSFGCLCFYPRVISLVC